MITKLHGLLLALACTLFATPILAVNVEYGLAGAYDGKINGVATTGPAFPFSFIFYGVSDGSPVTQAAYSAPGDPGFTYQRQSLSSFMIATDGNDPTTFQSYTGDYFVFRSGHYLGFGEGTNLLIGGYIGGGGMGFPGTTLLVLPGTGSFDTPFEYGGDDYSDLSGIGIFASSDQSLFPAPAPEPATWAMFLIGFGALGVAVRARRFADGIAA